MEDKFSILERVTWKVQRQCASDPRNSLRELGKSISRRGNYQAETLRCLLGGQGTERGSPGRASQVTGITWTAYCLWDGKPLTGFEQTSIVLAGSSS